MASHDPLILGPALLEQHFKIVGERLQSVAVTPRSIKLLLETPPVGIVATLGGEGCDFAARNRGGRVPVAPVFGLKRGMWLWMGYHEEWRDTQLSAKRDASKRRLSFRSSGITFYFGRPNDPFKPQVFRAEWAGWLTWQGNDYSFQAGKAAHPHWQFDVLESIADDQSSAKANELLQALQSSADREAVDFADLVDDNIKDLLLTQPFSRLHFMSAAHLWKSAPEDSWSHCPKTAVEIQKWVASTVNYIVDEFKRLV